MDEYFNIGYMAKVFDLSIKALRHYDKIGLLKPAHIDEKTNYRYYSIPQMSTLYIIKELKHQGFQLSEIHNFLNSDDFDYIRNLYVDKQNIIEEEINELSRMKHRISEKIRQMDIMKKALAKTENSIDIEIKEIPDKTILYKRHYTPFTFMGVALRTIELFNLYTSKNLQIIEPYFIIFHDDYKNLLTIYCDYEICAELEVESVKDAELKEKIDEVDFIRKLEGGTFVCTTFYGNYNKSLDIYDKMLEWIKKNNYEIQGPTQKFYITNYSLTKDVNKMVYEIRIPVKKKN
jgi:DNA-binding transcriptional MerR regulator